MRKPIENRYDFELIFDVENGNPNGDPDMGNMPRMDYETNVGIISDCCLKRKIRNFVDAVKENSKEADSYKIYIKDDKSLNFKDDEAVKYTKMEEKLGKAENEEASDKEKGKKKTIPYEEKQKLALEIIDFMCEHYYDIRTFGAVMTTFTKAGLNCGQLRGPVQLGFAKSVDPIAPVEISLTRMAATKEDDATEKGGRTMGSKYIVPYGLYHVEGFISANLARKSTGFSEEDLELFWEALMNMFEIDHAAGRGKMAVRKLIIFKHDNELGRAPAHKLFERIDIHRRDVGKVARSYGDYVIEVHTDNMPEGVTCEIRD
ncbi:type I-C CRISPR-associated protein Cas7/Csd2 [Selenomonas sp. KH1T6]|uniref:type I-C CRISPR-associated protein Cas7/Csd2 n=1 Tax=Selenomonas sp. KH1T6 TaxID=3158784 RepID=UPI0008A7AA7B|nr:CRISPR-associated protein Csd2 [Selenomonas ruminantium]